MNMGTKYLFKVFLIKTFSKNLDDLYSLKYLKYLIDYQGIGV